MNYVGHNLKVVKYYPYRQARVNHFLAIPYDRGDAIYCFHDELCEMAKVSRDNHVAFHCVNQFTNQEVWFKFSDWTMYIGFSGSELPIDHPSR